MQVAPRPRLSFPSLDRLAGFARLLRGGFLIDIRSMSLRAALRPAEVELALNRFDCKVEG